MISGTDPNQGLSQSHRVSSSTAQVDDGSGQTTSSSNVHTVYGVQLPQDNADPVEDQVRRDAQYAATLMHREQQQQQQQRAAAVEARRANESKATVLEGDEHKPYFIYCILGLNALVFIIELIVNSSENDGRAIAPLNENPLVGPTIEVLVMMGAKVAELIVVQGDWWRLIVPMFLHAGVIHLLVNSIFIWSFGSGLERSFGSTKTAYIYFASGFAGTVMSSIFLPSIPSVGASGACYGLIGAAWADLILNCAYHRGSILRDIFQLAFGTCINLAIGLMPFLDNFAHIGGLLVGFITGLSCLARPRFDGGGTEKPEHVYQMILTVGCTFLGPVLIIIGVVILFAEVDALERCEWCSLLSCVPTSWWVCEPTCNNEFQIEFRESIALLTCPGDLGIRIISSPFPELETEEQQLAFCEVNCYESE